MNASMETINNTPDDLITMDEVARMTSLSKAHLYHIYKTDIPHFDIGGTVRFSRSEVIAWINTKRVYTKKQLASIASGRCAARR